MLWTGWCSCINPIVATILPSVEKGIGNAITLVATILLSVGSREFSKVNWFMLWLGLGSWINPLTLVAIIISSVGRGTICTNGRPEYSMIHQFRHEKLCGYIYVMNKTDTSLMIEI